MIDFSEERAEHQLSCWYFVNNCYPSVGMKVRLYEQHACDYDFYEDYILTGITWNNHDEKFEVVLAEDWQEGGFDGFDLDHIHLSPIQ